MKRSGKCTLYENGHFLESKFLSFKTHDKSVCIPPYFNNALSLISLLIITYYFALNRIILLLLPSSTFTKILSVLRRKTCVHTSCTNKSRDCTVLRRYVSRRVASRRVTRSIDRSRYRKDAPFHVLLRVIRARAPTHARTHARKRKNGRARRIANRT